MKTIEEWFNLLPEEIAKKAFFNLEEQKMKSRDSKIGALSSALSLGFNWTDSPEQFLYWYELFIEIDKQEEEQESGSNEFVYNFDTFNN